MVLFIMAQENLNRDEFTSRINQLIRVMSEIQTNMSSNLYKFNSTWVDDGGMEGDVFYCEFQTAF
jgi:hypothetical protein